MLKSLKFLRAGGLAASLFNDVDVSHKDELEVPLNDSDDDDFDGLDDNNHIKTDNGHDHELALRRVCVSCGEFDNLVFKNVSCEDLAALIVYENCEQPFVHELEVPPRGGLAASLFNDVAVSHKDELEVLNDNSEKLRATHAIDRSTDRPIGSIQYRTLDLVLNRP